MNQPEKVHLNMWNHLTSLRGLLLSGLLAFALVLLSGCVHVTDSMLASYKDEKAEGISPRLEREYKLTLEGDGLQDYPVSEMADAIVDALKDTSMFRAESITNSPYFVDKKSRDFLFRDVYYDTKDMINYKHAVSYRLRHRWTSKEKYKTHLDDPTNRAAYPNRSEIQAKVNRQELGDGFSTVEEARFQFWNEEPPFMRDNSAPPPPWKLQEFVDYPISGRYGPYIMWPTKHLMSFLSQFENRESYNFEPSLVLLTDRQRAHLNMITEWASGPNPEHTYIISIDASRVYDGGEYIDKGIEGDLIGKLVEIEIEFERNVSRLLDQQIEDAKVTGNDAEYERLNKARDAFLEDQIILVEIISKVLEEFDITLKPANKSKYVQAVELL